MTSLSPISDAGIGETLMEADELADCDGKLDLADVRRLIRSSWSTGVKSAIDAFDNKAFRMVRDSSAISSHIARHLTKYASLDIDPDNLNKDAKTLYDALLQDRGLLLFIKRHLELRAITELTDCEDDAAPCSQELYLKNIQKLRLLVLGGAPIDQLLEALGAD